MLSSDLTTRICVNGKPIKTYYDEKGTKWVEARDNAVYTIEIKNNSSAKVLAVVSVDGINVINGKPAELKAEGGYIINPYSKIDIEGWRTSNETVKEFIFNFNKSESYSVKLGAGEQNLGVIGVAFYRSKELEINNWETIIKEYHHYHYPTYYPVWYYPIQPLYGQPIITCEAKNFVSISNYNSNLGNTTTYNCTADNCNLENADFNFSLNSESKSSYSSELNFQAGTAKGKEVDSRVEEIEFPAEIFVYQETIYYDSYENLKKRGVIKENDNKMPQPFKNTNYCPDI